MSSRFCEGRACVITGAGGGLGRSHALMLASAGARLIVNDVGAARDGTGKDTSAAEQVAVEIREIGGEAYANSDDISTWSGGAALISQAIDAFGNVDVVVNNAGILRDRMVFSMSEDDWDAVLRVHLKGTFVPTRHATAYWRDRAKGGLGNDARIINTTSISGIYGNVGQSNYGAAKAGIAAFTQIVAEEVGRYGVTANAVAPSALTRMTADLDLSEEKKERYDPSWVSPVVTWLASPLSRDITGQVIESSGLVLAIAQGWTRGPATSQVPRDPEEVDELIRFLLKDAQPRTTAADVL